MQHRAHLLLLRRRQSPRLRCGLGTGRWGGVCSAVTSPPPTSPNRVRPHRSASNGSRRPAAPPPPHRRPSRRPATSAPRALRRSPRQPGHSLRPVLVGRAASGELFQQRGELSLHLDHPPRRVQLSFQLGDPGLQAAFSRSTGSAGGRPRVLPNASKPPLSRCLRHSLISDEYNPSRRINAPRPSRSAASYSAKTSALYFAVYVLASPARAPADGHLLHPNSMTHRGPRHRDRHQTSLQISPSSLSDSYQARCLRKG